MSDQKAPSIRIEKASLERVDELHEVVLESSQEWFAEGMIFRLDLSREELEEATRDFLALWEKDLFYMFNILDGSTDQLLGFVLLNHINRTHQLANLGYAVRTSRMGEGVATQAARLAAQYGFEQLGLQRVEIVVRPENTASLKVAEKTGAVREGLLRNRLKHHGSPCDAYMHSLIPTDIGIARGS